MKKLLSQTLPLAVATLSMLSFAGRTMAQAYPPAWSSTGSYAVGDLVQKNGNTYRAIKAVSEPAPDPAANYTYWQLNQVQSNTTLMIGAGQTFPTLQVAWTYALYSRVSDGVYLHFYITTTGGNYAQTFNTPFLLDHSSGARIAILGDNPANISLNFFGTNGFIIDTGHSINTLSGFTMTNTGNTPIGIKADGNATITAIANLTITGFATCVQSTQNSTLTLLSSNTLENETVYAVDAESDGSVYCPTGITLTGPGSASNAYGFNATSGGVIIARNSTVTNFSLGADASFNGTVIVESSSLSGCSVGLEATSGGAISGSFATIGSCAFGVFAYDRGYIDVSQGTATGNSVDDLEAELGGYVLALYTTFGIQAYNGATDGSYIVS
jgi:hypothetical protein